MWNGLVSPDVGVVMNVNRGRLSLGPLALALAVVGRGDRSGGDAPARPVDASASEEPRSGPRVSDPSTLTGPGRCRG
ncbi:hypothetical protein NOCARDAX2BIS_520009 [Nocardioides sp. AX2bis]|nr:hypothetical protein NOCARDAX2BIS_520009 [Nocardioides sp. AX2bis]